MTVLARARSNLTDRPIVLGRKCERGLGLDVRGPQTVRPEAVELGYESSCQATTSEDRKISACCSEL
jgi:hypothetical protein